MNKLILFVLLVSCSSPLSTNQYESDKFVIAGGISGTHRWDDKLVFTRASWLQRATLLYQILLADIPKDSPFREWFTDSERDYVKSCKQLVIGLHYVYKFALIPVRNLQDQMRALGFKEMVSVNFERQVFNHSDTTRIRAKHYKILFYCQEMVDINKVSIEVPGHEAHEVLW